MAVRLVLLLELLLELLLLELLLLITMYRRQGGVVQAISVTFYK
jgi:hypothetical protein